MNTARRPGANAIPAIVLCFVLLLCLLPPGAVGAATPGAYDAALAQVQAALARQTRALQQGRALPPAQTPSQIAARLLPPLSAIDRPGQAPQPVDTLLLLAAVRRAGTAGDVKHRVAELRAVSDQITTLRREVGAAGVASGAPGAAERVARNVLSSRAYASDPLPPPSLLDRFTGWLERVITRWLRSLHFGRGPALPYINPGFVKGIVIVLLAGVFAVLVAVLVQWLRRRPARSQPLALDETEAALVDARDTDSLRALAEEQARSGDFRRAFRLIYLATLVALDTGGVLRFDRSKTNWEYLRALRASGRADVYEALSPLTREFDRLWYGAARAGADDYARALTHYDALQAASKSSARATAAA